MNQLHFLDDAAGPIPSTSAPESRSATPLDQDRALPRERGRSTQRKHFVVDTNVLLHDPGCLGRFADNHVCIPVDVLTELDRFKNEHTDRGANSRAVHRALTAHFGAGGGSVTDGVPTAGGGTLRLLLFDPPGGARKPAWFSRFERHFGELGRIDHRILATTLALQQEIKDPVILVTKDLNMQLKARALGLACEDYLNDKVSPAEVSSFELRRIEVTPTELQRFASSGSLELEPDRREGLTLNEYILLHGSEKQTMPARVHADGLLRRLAAQPLIRIPNGATVRAINLGQQCLLDALLDPAIALVTCYGHAGTGKTLLAVAAGLHAVLTGASRGVTISRPVVSMGDTLGFLPGTLDEKMRPWLQPIYDALEFLMPVGGSDHGDDEGRKRRNGKAKPQKPQKPQRHDAASFSAAPAGRTTRPYEALIEKGVVEIEALCYIRGRSIPHRFFILDEAQQLTPLEAKTVVTRMSKNSKLVMVGDPAQIDNPYVDSRSNGLVYTRDRLRGQQVAAHVALSRGERSALAELGATLM